MFARKKCLLSVGCFDENFFLYSEDIDLCKRVGESGWKLFLMPGSPVVHHEGKSYVRKDKRPSPERYRGEFYYFRKHHGGASLFILRLLVCVSLIVPISMKFVKYVFTLGANRNDFEEQLDFSKKVVSASYEVNSFFD